MKFYKAVAPDYFDFATQSIEYLVGSVVEHPEPGIFGRGEADGYLSVTTEPTACIGAMWPIRLLEVEADHYWAPHPNGTNDYDKKRAVHKLRVLRELPATNFLGPQGERVAELHQKSQELQRIRRSTDYAYTDLTSLENWGVERIYRVWVNNGLVRQEIKKRDSAVFSLDYNIGTDALKVLIIQDLLQEVNDPEVARMLDDMEEFLVRMERLHDKYIANKPETFMEKLKRIFGFGK